jgi:phage replication O-like protein O
MASPQKENGYTPISNEILEALSKTRINTDAWRILLVVIRKTYGFKKKQDKISLSQFVLATQLKKSVVCRGLNRLQSMNIIIRIANDDCTIYQFNKDFDTWKPLAKLLTLAKQLTPVSQIANASLAKQGHTKETTTKETLTKEIYSGQSPQDIDEVINIFSKINPTIKWGNITTRKAAARLIKRFTKAGTIRMAEQICSVQGERYAPTCTTPYQMEEKLAQFKIYFDKQKGEGVIKI